MIIFENTWHSDEMNLHGCWKHAETCQKNPNSPIESYNHELKSVMVNKGRINGELRYFFKLNQIERWMEVRN